MSDRRNSLNDLDAIEGIVIAMALRDSTHDFDLDAGIVVNLVAEIRADLDGREGDGAWRCGTCGHAAVDPITRPNFGDALQTIDGIARLMIAENHYDRDGAEEVQNHCVVILDLVQEVRRELERARLSGPLSEEVPT